jgi:hypothetical protein
MYSIRYLFKNAGSQIAFWNRNVGQDALTAMEIADVMPRQTKSETMTDTGWVNESPNFWRRKIVFAINSPEENNFSLHINVGREEDSHLSNL